MPGPLKQCIYMYPEIGRICRHFAMQSGIRHPGGRGKCVIHANPALPAARLLAPLTGPGTTVLRRCNAACPLGESCDHYNRNLPEKAFDNDAFCAYELAEMTALAQRLAEQALELGAEISSRMVQRGADAVSTRLLLSRIARHLATDGVAKTVVGKNGEVCGAESSSLTGAWHQALKAAVEAESAWLEAIGAASSKHHEDMAAILRQISREVFEQSERLVECCSSRELSAA